MRSHAAQFLFAALATSAMACFNPVNAVTYDRYFEAGAAAADAGDLPQAKIFYSRAVINAQIGFLGPKAEAAALYNYGRVVGKMCEYDNARSSFERALVLEEQAEGPDSGFSSMRLFELARLSVDNEKYSDAVGWYARAIALTRKMGADRGDPIAFANELDGFATALEHTGDLAQAAELRRESAQIRADHPGMLPGFVAEHYPKECPKT
jgi:tetratricopeptide (TPR) repeat protein